MRSRSVVKHLQGALTLVVACLATAVGGAAAQTSTGSIRGFVTNESGAPLAGATITATNTNQGTVRNATTRENGFYALPSLTPGLYEVSVRRLGSAPQTRQLRVGIGEVITANFRLADTVATLGPVVVSAVSTEMRTSEMATNVTQEQINDLPTAGRNFLDLAMLAPGTRISLDRLDGTGKTFAAGALPPNNINVFIDGTSYKNDIITGGVAGQDASRGNPFPRNAIQEFRITTNNFKAEYQKASSAIITAITKSGGNRWTGNAFLTFQNDGLVALDTFQRAQRATNPSTFVEPDYSRYLIGLSAGGPLIRDKLFFFGSYEGNYQNRQGLTRFNGDPSTWPAPVAALNGEGHTSPFRSHLGFAKLTYNMNDHELLEVSGDARFETDKRRFGGQFAGPDRAFEAGENFRNDIVTGRVKHTYFGSGWTNEALASYQWYKWNPEPFDFTTPGRDYQGIGRIGGADSRQDLTQQRLSFRDDFTYTGWQWSGAHVVKVGMNYDFAHYDMNKQLNENPIFTFNANNNFAFPISARLGFGDPSITANNHQFGVYAQDDWTPVPRLTINVGVRWDLETGMYNRDYVTPQAVRDSLTLYRDSLFLDIDPNRYFTDGSDRKLFLGAIQPRIGASYALDADGRTTVFASFGVFYDRLEFNATLDESYRRQHPDYIFQFSADGSTPGTIAWDDSYFSREGLEGIIASGNAPAQEVFLIPNDLKPPRSNQWTMGIRHDFGTWNAQVSYNGTRSYNGFSFEWANVALDPAKNDCCISHNVPAYLNVLVGNNDVHTWYDALFVQVDRPYQRTGRWGWGAGVAYTLSKAEAEGGDLFSFPTVTAGFNSRHPIADDQRHQFVINWIADVPYAWGIQFSGLAQFASGKPFNKVSFAGGPTGTERTLLGVERAPWFKNVDLRLRKDFPTVGGTTMAVTASLFNVFNTQNLGCFNTTFIRGDGTPEPGFGNAGCVISDPRRFQLGVQYDF